MNRYNSIPIFYEMTTVDLFNTSQRLNMNFFKFPSHRTFQHRCWLRDQKYVRANCECALWISKGEEQLGNHLQFLFLLVRIEGGEKIILGVIISLDFYHLKN